MNILLNMNKSDAKKYDSIQSTYKCWLLLDLVDFPESEGADCGARRDKKFSLKTG